MCVGFSFTGDYRGESFQDRYIGCNFSRADLTGAHLDGIFIRCVFNATWREADRTGSFVDCLEQQSDAAVF